MNAEALSRWGGTEEALTFGATWPLWYGASPTRKRSAAVKIFRKLADAGYAPALCGLGEAYFHGEGVRRDYGAAYRFHRLAADEGYPSSAGQIGALHLMAQPAHEACALDPAEAARWFERAAAAGNAGAQFNLASSYDLGRGVAADPQQAYLWASLAVHCSRIRMRPAEALRDRTGAMLSAPVLAELEQRIASLRAGLPLPWSEHHGYWKSLAALAGVEGLD